jgi:cytochrome bd-type quinol oxidase subunit 2
METPPPEKKLRLAPFAIHATRGLLRNQSSRRKTMAVCLVVAVLMLVAGLTVLRPWLNPHEHAARFIFYWFACAWETLLVFLLALLDLLLIRAQARDARKAFREQFSPRTDSAEQDGPEEK